MLIASRGRVASVVAGLVATSMLGFTGTTAGAAEPAGVATVRVADTAPRPVLENKFGTLKSRVVGEFGKNGVVKGTFKPRRFVMQDGNMMAVGLLHAKLIRGNGEVVGTEDKVVTLPVKTMSGESAGRVAARAASCDILNLVLGPLDLDLLGLKVHLDKVVLNITAEPGSGNLLGNLLCAVAGLLDNTGVLTQIRQILNSIIGILKL